MFCSSGDLIAVGMSSCEWLRWIFLNLKLFYSVCFVLFYCTWTLPPSTSYSKFSFSKYIIWFKICIFDALRHWFIRYLWLWSSHWQTICIDFDCFFTEFLDSLTYWFTDQLIGLLVNDRMGKSFVQSEMSLLSHMTFAMQCLLQKFRCQCSFVL